MRTNLPITGRERTYDARQMLVSVTDLKGRILHANDAFVAVSGFTREELVGKSHNIVRHPDMPPAAFADLWTTLKAGLPWTALVKNRCKNGDHYWVKANVTPVVANGQVTSYLSVRIQPSRQEVERAEALYAGMRAGHAGLPRLEGGRLLPTGLRALPALAARLGLAGRITAVLALGAAVPVTGAALGLGGWAVAGLAAAACGATAAWLVRGFAAPLGYMRTAVWRLAAADLSVRLDSGRGDEVGDIYRGLTQMAINLRALVQDVGLGSSVLSEATAEIAAGNADLSQRTETQAANLQQTAASMEQINASVTQSASAARRATQMAGAASDAAARGGEVMGRVVSTMDQITSSSTRIGAIIQAIEGIAFQTNILALNAAVEAARAGEQGRGFAVVASEVRNLAGRSAEAAKEIRALVQASIEDVKSGSRLVHDAGGAINDIVSQVASVAKLVGEIGAAAGEQTGAIGQINAAVTELDQVTQRNAALVEQSARAAGGLNRQAARLAEAVGIFSTGHTHSHPA